MSEKIHIGKLIQNKMEEEGRKVSWLAEKINYDKSNIYRIFQHASIDTDLLVQISIHLKINLFSYCSNYVNERFQEKIL